METLKREGIRVVAISYDSVNILDAFAKKRKITFPLLADPESQLIEAFGIRNQEAKGRRIDGVPYPGTFIINPQGKIGAKLFHEGYKQRHTSQDIVEAVKELKGE